MYCSFSDLERFDRFQRTYSDKFRSSLLSILRHLAPKFWTQILKNLLRARQPVRCATCNAKGSHRKSCLCYVAGCGCRDTQRSGVSRFGASLDLGVWSSIRPRGALGILFLPLSWISIAIFVAFISRGHPTEGPKRRERGLSSATRPIGFLLAVLSEFKTLALINDQATAKSQSEN